MKKIHYIMLIALTTMLASCHNNQFYFEHQHVDIEGWPATQVREFEVTVSDTTTPFDFFLDMRHNDLYPYENVYFFITTTFPDGTCAKDTLECPVATPDGAWLGNVTTRYAECRYPLKTGVVFPMAGTYRFSIAHGMRDTALVGISSVGLCILHR